MKTEKEDISTSVGDCVVLNSVNMKQEMCDLDIGPIQFQPPDICYAVKTEVTDGGLSASGRNPEILEACEDSVRIHQKQITLPLEEATPDEYQSKNLQCQSNNHKSSKLFECSICKKEFKGKRNINKHMRSHTDQKPYACSRCNYKTASARDLKHHRRRHIGEKRFVRRYTIQQYRDMSLMYHEADNILLTAQGLFEERYGWRPSRGTILGAVQRHRENGDYALRQGVGGGRQREYASSA